MSELKSSSVWEQEYNRPEYHRPIVALMEDFLRQDRNADLMRDFSGGLLPTEVNWNKAYGMAGPWAGTDRILRAYDEYQHASGITNDDVLKAEYQVWKEHGEKSSTIGALPTLLAQKSNIYQNLSTSDIAIPSMVMRWYIETVFPMLSNLEMFNVHPVSSSRAEFRVESRNPVTSIQITIPLTGRLAADDVHDLNQRNLDLTRPYSMGAVMQDDYVINPVTGMLRNISDIPIVLDNLTIYQFPYGFAEESAPPESKVSNVSDTLEMEWDGISVQLTHRAQAASVGSHYPLLVRALSAAAFEIREMVDRSLANYAQYALQHDIPGNKIYSLGSEFGDVSMPLEAYSLVGKAITSLRKAGYMPSRLYANHDVLRLLSELYDTVADSSINVEDSTEVLSIVPRVKGLPPKGIRYWTDPFMVVAKPPIADYAVLASQPFTVSSSIPGSNATGNVIARQDFLCHICHWIGGPFKWENISVIKE